jgi:hypothetical protein
VLLSITVCPYRSASVVFRDRSRNESPTICRSSPKILIEIGGPTSGANINSMVGFSWGWCTNRLYSMEYQTVYFVAPLIGGLLAAGVYNSTTIFLPSKQEFSAETSSESNASIVEISRPPPRKKSAKKGNKGKSSVSSDKKSPKVPASIDNSKPKTRSQIANPQLRKRSKK